MADTSTKKKTTVSGHVEDVRGIWHIKLTWTDQEGKRGRKSISTGLAIKGNKGKAENLLSEAKKDQESELKNMPRLDNMLFADFMENWLDVIRPEIRPTTFGGYQMNITRIIAPYFRKKRTLLCELTADEITEFLRRAVKT